jgi:hypothetical protein
MDTVWVGFRGFPSRSFVSFVVKRVWGFLAKGQWLFSVFKDHPPVAHFRPEFNVELYHLFALMSSKNGAQTGEISGVHGMEQAFMPAVR